MPRLSKRKQQLAQIAPLALESIKRRKIVSHTERDKAFNIQQRQKDDFWDEYKSDCVKDSSSDESSSDDLSDSDAGEDPERKDSKKEKETGLKNTDKLVLPMYKPGDGNYLRAVRGTGSLSTEKRQRRRVQEREKTALGSHSIATLFARQQSGRVFEESTLGAQDSTSSFLKQKNVETDIRAKATHDLSKLIRLKNKQIEKYGAPFVPQSNLYLRHQMVQSFLWMQSKRDTDNPKETRRTLASMVAQRFNRSPYTGRRIIHCEKEWISSRKILGTKAGGSKYTVSWMDDEDLVMAIKIWAKGEGHGISSYKLAQFTAKYLRNNRSNTEMEGINTPEQLEQSILDGGILQLNGTVSRKSGIRSRTARRWLHQLGYSWRDVRKGVFFDGHERPDVVEYQNKFLAEMEALKPYLVEFEEDGSIKSKVYPQDCKVGGSSRQPVILITHDESTFNANDGRRQVWQKDAYLVLRPKGKGRGIMVSDFLLPWSQLNLLSLPLIQQTELASLGVPLKAVEFFEYGKNNKGYWKGEHLLKQVVEKALSIGKALYPGYQLLFLFDNATSHSVFASDALQADEMNKSTGGQQRFLRDGWYTTYEGNIIQQEMCFEHPSLLPDQPPIRVQKGIQMVLEERNLWPAGGLKLGCDKPKCSNCQAVSACKLCIKGKRCESCIKPKVHSGKCDKSCTCDEYVSRRDRCQCIQKTYCIRCKEYSGQKSCLDCDKMPPKCSSSSCCARRLLSLQPDFMEQKCKIEEKVQGTLDAPIGHRVMYYPKFHCELNHIEFFWCDCKSYTRRNCTYTIEGLREVVPRALRQVKHSTILGHFNSCMRKMDGYREGIEYGSSEWKTLTSHQKPWNKGDDDR